MNDMIHIRLEPRIKQKIEQVRQELFFSSTSEFIKDAIRKQLEDYERQLILRKHLASRPDRKLTEKHKREAVDEALRYKGDIFKDLGLR